MESGSRSSIRSSTAIFSLRNSSETTFDAGVANTTVLVRAVSSPVRRFTAKTTFRYRERDNKTSRLPFSYVNTDVRPASTRYNVAYDYKRYDYKLAGEYRFNSRYRLHGGYDHQRYKRSDQQRKRTSTDRVWSKLKTRPYRNANLDLEVYGEWRDGSSYRPSPPGPNMQNPLLRRYNLADRDRLGVKLFGSLMLGERADIGFDIEYADIDFPDSVIGLTDGSSFRWGLNGNYALPRNGSIYSAVYGEDHDSDVANSGSLRFLCT